MGKTRRLFKGKLLLVIALLCVAIFNRDSMTSDSSIVSSAQHFNNDNINRDILYLQNIGERKTWHGQSKASSYIKSRLREIGLIPKVDVYQYINQQWENVWVEFKGFNEKEKKIIIITHYDSTSRNLAPKAPGSDDNASGVSLLMELASYIKVKKFTHDVQLVFFSNEEHGRAGSKNYAKKLKKENTIVSGVLNIDIVGYNNPGAIFSKELPNIFTLELPVTRKVKMVYKMLYNYGINVIYNGKKFKIAGRVIDKHLYSANIDDSDEQFAEKIRWKFGDMCA